MPDTVGVSAGTVIKMHDGVSTYTALGEVTGIGDLIFESPQVDATRLSSAFREYVSGVKDTPESQIDFRLKMDDATQDEVTGVNKVFNDGVARLYRIKFPGQVKGLQFTATPVAHGWTGLRVNELMGRRFSIKISGAVTIADATSW